MNILKPAFLLSALFAFATLQGCISAKSEPTPEAEPAAKAVVAEVIGDSDGDGVLDDIDECPNTRPGVQVDAKGCEILHRFIGPLFDFDKASLTAEAQSMLNEAAAVLAANPGKNIEVAGHTDSIGDADYNMDLGMRRATSVMEYLAANGVTSNMNTVSYGETQPIADNGTKEGRHQNRRVELIDLSQ